MRAQLGRMLSVPSLADALLPAVINAARIQMRYFRSGTEVVAKADASPVTAADREAETLILAALARIAPDVPVVAEEAAAAGQIPDLPHGSGREFFLVDPLDGTREFVAGRKEFTINIALVRDCTPCFGFIYAPALGQGFVTLSDNEVVAVDFLPSSDATTLAQVNAQPIRARVPSPDGLVALASRSHASAGTDAFLGQYRILRRTSAGSSLKFGLLARGEADIYPRFGQTCEWDTAAGQAILQAAGGSVTTVDGAPLRYGNVTRRFLNPDFVAWGRGPIPPQY